MKKCFRFHLGEEFRRAHLLAGCRLFGHLIYETKKNHINKKHMSYSKQVWYTKGTQSLWLL